MAMMSHPAARRADQGLDQREVGQEGHEEAVRPASA